MIRILILCTGNSCRSQMAEGWFRNFLGDKGEIFSAGTAPHAIHPLAIEVMRETGIDLSSHSSNNALEYINDQFDFVITVCNNAAKDCPTFPGQAVRLHWPFDDPASVTGTDEAKLVMFRRVRDEIRSKIENWLNSCNA